MDWCEPDTGRAESRAQRVIHELGLTDPDEIDIDVIAFLRGARVIEASMTGCEGRLIRRGSKGFITISNTIREPGRRRFGVAHELGHFELHGNNAGGQLGAFGDTNLGQYFYRSVNPEEREADAFASEILMPEKMFRPRCNGFRPSFEGVEDLASQFATTLTATARRYVQFSPWDCVLVYSKEGVRKWFVKGDEFPLRINLTALNPESPAAAAFLTRRSTKGMKRVSARFWFDGQVPANLTVLEDSRVMGAYGSMLTLLWLDQPVESSAWYDR